VAARVRQQGVRDVHDFPEPGIVFKDLSPLLRDSHLLAETIEMLAEPFVGSPPSVVVGIEARGFIFGTLIARALSVGFVPLRKPGKLPGRAYSVDYDLEYGSATLQMHEDALGAGDSVLLVDDLLATGGTAQAGLALIERAGARLTGAAFVVELEKLRGRERLGCTRVHSLLCC